MATTYEHLEASLLNFCLRFADAMIAQGVTDRELEPYNFENVGSEDELEEKDLVGISNLSIEMDDHFLELELLIGISTYDDLNNFRLRKLCGYLFEELKPTNALPVVDADTGLPLGGKMLVLNGTRMMPVTGNTRPTRFFIVQLKATLTQELGPNL